ncbi:MAG: phosphatase PAP2 family protein [Ginsengibacter sp.]
MRTKFFVKASLTILMVFTYTFLLAQIPQEADSSKELSKEQKKLPPVNLQNESDSNQVIDVKKDCIPKKFFYIKNIPGDMVQLAKAPFQKKNLKGLVATAAATGLLLFVDEPFTKGVRQFSRAIGVSTETSYYIPLKLGGTKLLKFPRNPTSFLYQLGEGATTMVLAGGIYIFGEIKNDKRAIYTAGDLTETFISMGIATQIVKRITGRESPYQATQKGGRWSPLPSFSEYQKHTSHYDAFPSGHLATIMGTVTTLALDYPEKRWIKPVGYTVMGLVGLAMVNTEVHWVSDYPLALAMGYLSAKITHFKNHKCETKSHKLTDNF